MSIAETHPFILVPKLHPSKSLTIILTHDDARDGYVCCHGAMP